MDNYKGLYYKETKEQKFYEGGAHFPYEELYEILVYLKEEQDKQLKKEMKEQNKNKQNDKNPTVVEENSNIHIYDLIQNHNNNNNANKAKTRTRNVMNSCFYNNPNTMIKKSVGKNKSKNQQINIGISFNEKKDQSKSRNYKNDYGLFYNKTSNQANRDDKNIIQEVNISGIKTRNNISNYLQRKYIGKNNSTNQMKHRKINLNNYLYSNIQKEYNRNNITEKNFRNDSYILNNSKKFQLYNNLEHSKTKNLNNSNNYSKGKKVNSSTSKINNININDYLNNKGHLNKRQRNFSGLNGQISHNINNYINVNINNHNNINVNINNVSYKNNRNQRNKNNSLNGILMTLNKSNNRKYSNNKVKEKDDKKGDEFILDYIKINKSRNINKKSALGHVKSMDFNNKPLTIELIGIENNTFYDKTFCNNNNDMNKNQKMNINNNFKINMPKQMTKFSMNYSYMKMKKDSIKKNNNEIWSKYYGYFKKLNKK